MGQTSWVNTFTTKVCISLCLFLEEITGLSVLNCDIQIASLVFLIMHLNYTRLCFFHSKIFKAENKEKCQI